ncbi:MAG: Rrf2 family transcriptional regulator [Deltaproteobacteria bacterium]|nr:Rrf2 family transcriptional regulator [Deltaproteobacteria bacterium]
MFQVTRMGDYAIRGMVHLAGQPEGETRHLGDIASDIEVPRPLLAKIFQQLGRAGLVISQRGAGGGFSLGRPAEKISLLEIVEAAEGPISLNRCLLGKGVCGRDAFCTVHPVWKEAQEGMRSVLGKVTLKHLAGQDKEAPAEPRRETPKGKNRSN